MAGRGRQPAAQGGRELPPPPGAVRVGDEQARVAAGQVGEHVGRQRPRAADGQRGERHRGHPAGQRPAGRLGQARDRGKGRGRAGGEQVEQVPPQLARLPGELGPGLGVPGRAGGGELVHVPEDRLPDEGERLRVPVALPGLLVQALPGDAGADAQRGLQRAEAASLHRQQPPEVAEHGRPPTPSPAPGRPAAAEAPGWATRAPKPATASWATRRTARAAASSPGWAYSATSRMIAAVMSSASEPSAGSSQPAASPGTAGHPAKALRRAAPRPRCYSRVTPVSRAVACRPECFVAA